MSVHKTADHPILTNERFFPQHVKGEMTMLGKDRLNDLILIDF